MAETKTEAFVGKLGCWLGDAGFIVTGSGSKLLLFDRSSYISNTHIPGDALNTKPTPL